MIPRNRYYTKGTTGWGVDYGPEDEVLPKHYTKKQNPCRQLVLLGAGMDARAYHLDKRLYGGWKDGLVVFEVDRPTTFEYKESLLWGEELRVKNRVVVPFEFTEQNDAEPFWPLAAYCSCVSSW